MALKGQGGEGVFHLEGPLPLFKQTLQALLVKMILKMQSRFPFSYGKTWNIPSPPTTKEGNSLTV